MFFSREPRFREGTTSSAQLWDGVLVHGGRTDTSLGPGKYQGPLTPDPSARSPRRPKHGSTLPERPASASRTGAGGRANPKTPDRARRAS